MPLTPPEQFGSWPLRSQMCFLLFISLGTTTQALAPSWVLTATDKAHNYNMNSYPSQPAMPFPTGFLPTIKSLQYNFSMASIACQFAACFKDAQVKT